MAAEWTSALSNAAMGIYLHPGNWNAAFSVYGNPSLVLAGLRPDQRCKIKSPLTGHAPIRVKSQLAEWR